MKPVMAIAITEFSIFSRSKKLHLRFRASEVSEPEIMLSEHFEVHVLRLHQLLKKELARIRKVKAELAHWLAFLILGKEEEGNMSDFAKEAMREPVIREAFEQPVIKEAKRQFDAYRADPVAQDMERRRQKFLYFQQYHLDMARKQGVRRGKTQNAREVAARMKAHGDAVSYIAEISGLPVEAIEKL